MDGLEFLGMDSCDCVELIDANGARFPAPRFHDCDYCRARNALIPQAEKIATSKVAIVRDDGESTARWTREFSTAMDELARPLLNGRGQRLAPAIG